MNCNSILIGDCIEVLAKLPANFADLVFCDPPYNLGVAYDRYRDRLERNVYLDWADAWIAAALRVLKPYAAFWVVINDDFVADYKNRLDAAGLTRRNWIVWSYGFGFYQQKKFTPCHVHLLYYVADPKEFTFNTADIRIESERQRLGDKRANPAGRIPGSVWSVPRVAGTFRERRDHPAQMPEKVLEPIIRATTNPGDMVLDPMCGTGTTVAVAKRLGRQFLGIELSAGYAEQIQRRLAGVTRSLAEV